MKLRSTRRWISIISLLPGLLLISCTDEKDRWYPVPENASVVIAVDPARISKKVLLDKLGELDFSDLFYSSQEDTSQQNDLSSLLDSPSEAGIDILEKIYLFKDGDMMGVYAALDNEKDLYNHLQNNLKKKIGEYQKYKFAYLDSNLIAWNKDHCLLLFKKDLSRVKQDELESLLEIKKGKTVFKNSGFIQSAAEPSDIFIWIHIPDLFNEHPSFSQLARELFNKHYSTAHISFEKGKIDVSIKELLHPEIDQLLKSPTEANIYNSPFIPTGALHIDIAKGLEFIKSDSVEKTLGDFQITKRELIETFTGQILFDLSGLKQREKKYTSYTYDDDFNKIETVETVKEIYPSFSLFIGSKDSSQTGKILQALSTKRLMDKKTNHYEFSLTAAPMIVYNTPNGILLTDEKDPGNPLPAILKEKEDLKSHFNNPFFILIDPEKFSLLFNKEDPKNILLNAVESAFLKIERKGTNRTILSSEIKFKKQDQNSFLTIIDMLKEKGK